MSNSLSIRFPACNSLVLAILGNTNCLPEMAGFAASEIFPGHLECLLLADSVEKNAVAIVILAAASHLAWGYLLDMPSSVQMMDFVG